MTTLRLGGPVERVIDCTDSDRLVDTVRGCDADRQPLIILGGGSNIVAADDGFGGTVARVRSMGVETRVDRDRVLLRVQAGEPWDALVSQCVNDGLVGLETLAGIPGTVGATPIQNVGAYGGAVEQTIVEVVAFDRVEQRVTRLSRLECGFSYRSSVFKRSPGRWVVLEVVFGLQRGTHSMPISIRRAGTRARDRAGGAGAACRREPRGPTTAIGKGDGSGPE